VCSFAALNLQAVSGRPPDRQPGAAAAFQTAVQGGGALVLTVLATAPPAMAPPLIIAVAVAGLLVAAPGAIRPNAPALVHDAPAPIQR
jgi:hypothetical protein